jgi:lysophospholipid acyltransferase (LPLAT)-like uncharacterized protein
MSNLYDQVTGSALALLSRIYAYTCRKQFSGIENLHQALDSGRPLILTAWHGKAFMVISCLLSIIDPSTFNVLMPNDWRGGTLSVLTTKLGAKPYPMDLFDDPTLGMGRQMVKVVRHVMSGEHTIIAPDGPDGPAYVPKPGITYLARKARALIVPFGGFCRNAYHLNRWDHYTLPFPFSRISIHVGEPFEIASDENDLSRMDEHLINVLHRVTAQAAANYYPDHRPSRLRD